jgi:hypothetical protein
MCRCACEGEFTDEREYWEQSYVMLPHGQGVI